MVVRTMASGDLYFSTNDLAPALRREMVCDVISSQLMQVSVDTLNTEVNVTLHAKALPDLGITRWHRSPMSLKHLPNLATNDNLVLAFADAPIFGWHGQHAFSTTPDTGVLMACGENGERESHCKTSINLSFDRARLRSLAPNAEDWIGRVIPNTGAMTLLKNYLNLLAHPDRIEPELGKAISDHLYDLMALALGASNEACHNAMQRGARAARLHAIKADIASRLQDAALSAASLCARHQISERYLRSLFAADGTTLTNYIANSRITLAYNLLTDPAHLHRTISDIAYAVGFGDLSYFNRLFRRRYGVTPRQVRRT